MKLHQLNCEDFKPSNKEGRKEPCKCRQRQKKTLKEFKHYSRWIRQWEKS